jgi:pyruvate kinase
VLSNNKGINRKGGGLSAAALTEKDMEDIKTAAMIKADYLAVSFPRSAADVELARELLHAPAASLDRRQDRTRRGDRSAGRNRQASDAIMVARGDLAWKSAMPPCRRCRNA